MLNVQRILKPYKETGALNENIPFWGFVDDEVFLTKGGDVGVVLGVSGVDHECLDRDSLDNFTKRFQSAVKPFDHHFRIYQILLHHNRPLIPFGNYSNPTVRLALQARLDYLNDKSDKLYDLEIYYVILYSGTPYKTGVIKALSLLPSSPPDAFAELVALFSTEKQVRFIERDIDRSINQLRSRIQQFRLQVADYLPVDICKKNKAFYVFRRLLNPDPVKWRKRLRYDTHLDYFVTDSVLEAHSRHLYVDGFYLRVVTLKDTSSHSWPLIFRKIYEIKANYHVVSCWSPTSTDTTRSQINSARRHFNVLKTSMASHVSDDVNPNDRLVDDSKVALVAQLGDALKEIELNGNYFGDFTLSFVFYDRDPQVVDSAVSEVYKIVSDYDGSVFEESYNLLNSYFSTLPGNDHFNLRKLRLCNTNYADYSFIFSLTSGERINSHLRDEYCAILETTHNTPYFLNLHHGDIAHSLILGMTGSGKSFLLNFLATNIQKYGGFTFFFDLGGSFQSLTKLFGGAYLKVGMSEHGEARTDFRINPFCIEPTKQNLNFLFSFVRVLIESRDQYKLSVEDERELYLSIQSIYSIDPDVRTLGSLSNLLPRHLSEKLHKWVRGDPPGQYSSLFDNVVDTLEISRFQCFDFEGSQYYPDVVEPLLFYLLHRSNAAIYDPRNAKLFKVFFVDEAWRFFAHPVIRSYIVEALKTWRKRNAAMILSTQSVADVATTDILDILVESCPTKIFLSNPSLNEDFYRDSLKVTPKAISLIKELTPKRQFLMYRPDVIKVLQLDVDPRSYWIYTNDPNDNAKRLEAFDKYGFERGLDHLVTQKTATQSISEGGNT